MKDGRADAFALSRDSLAPVRDTVPGSRIVTGGSQHTGVALAVPKDRPATLAFATAWLTGAKREGTVRRIFDAHGLGSRGLGGVTWRLGHRDIGIGLASGRRPVS